MLLRDKFSCSLSLNLNLKFIVFLLLLSKVLLMNKPMNLILMNKAKPFNTRLKSGVILTHLEITPCFNMVGEITCSLS